MRIQLGAPDNTFLTPEKYNQIFTMHGTTMIFLFVVPMWAGFANYLVPLMIGARDMAFPRLNALVLLDVPVRRHRALRVAVLHAARGRLVLLRAAVAARSTRPSGGQDAWIYMIHLTGLSSMLGAINFFATIHNMRAPGMGWGRLPLFVWTILIYAYLIVLALPSLAAAVTMLLLDRNFGTHVLRPDRRAARRCCGSTCSGSSATPRSTSSCCPAFGIFSEVLPVFARKPIFGYKAIAAVDRRHRLPRPAGVGAPHVRDADVDRRARVLHAPSFLIAVPTGVKIFNWVATLWRGIDRVPRRRCSTAWAASSRS